MTALCATVYLGTLRTSDFIHDDLLIIAENPLLRGGWGAVADLLTTGYWEAIRGREATVQEYRPVLMLTFFIQKITTGDRAPPMHALNILLHAAVSVLVFLCLRRRMALRSAAAAALVFAALPVHTEAVSSLTGRSEVLSAGLLLAAWMILEARPEAKDRLSPPGRTLALGAALYVAAMLTKEHAVLLPLLLALGDWCFHGRSPLAAGRRRVYAVLSACALAWVGLRLTFLSRIMHVGTSYFAGTSLLDAALTFSRFAFLHYAWPGLSGTDLCSDFSRPGIPDSGPSDLLAWACLLSLLLLAVWTVRAALRRRPLWAFWLLGPGLFLLPTSHLVATIDTIGAERFLYLPSVGLAALMGLWFGTAAERRPRTAWTALILVLAWYGWRTVDRNRVWTSDRSFYGAALACNPFSAKAHSAMGASLITDGRAPEGKYHIIKAIGLNPRLANPYYNLGRLAWDQRDLPQAEAQLRRSLDRDPGSPDSWVLLGIVLERLGRADEAAAALNRALLLKPWDPLAHYNMGRLYLSRGLKPEAARHFRDFLRLAPDDPQAGPIANLVIGLDAPPSGQDAAP